MSDSARNLYSAADWLATQPTFSLHDLHAQRAFIAQARAAASRIAEVDMEIRVRQRDNTQAAAGAAHSLAMRARQLFGVRPAFKCVPPCGAAP